MIKMSRIIFTLRATVKSYQNGFGGNDLAEAEEVLGGGSQDIRREDCALCLC